MCGISGIIGPSRPADIHKMTATAAYRGPDDCAHLVGNGLAGTHSLFKDVSDGIDGSATFDLALGHRRLAILDLSADGRQPMPNDGGDIWITYNGEIFNYIELERELESQGCRFKTSSDTEVILKAYETWGVRCFERFNGMWAIGLWDVKRRRLILSRDRFGIKPLYYFRDGDRFLFASEIKQILAVIASKPELNLELVEAFLVHGMLETNDDTFFRGIKKVPAAHFIVIPVDKPLSGAVVPERYWHIRNIVQNPPISDPVEDFYAIFSDAVRLRLRSDVKVGCLLSGGLDSSAIASVMSDVAAENNGHPGNFTYIASCSIEKKYDEQHFIDAVRDFHGLQVVKVFPEARSSLDLLSKVIWHQEEPFGSFSVVAQYLLYEAASQHGLKVVLSGQGGDEILCGYKKYYIFHLLNLFRHHKSAFLKEFVYYLWNNKISHLRLSEAKRYLPSSWRRRFDPISDILQKNRFPSSSHQDLIRSKSINEIQRRDIEQSSIPALVHYEDRNAMAFSVEARLPFLDHRLVEFTLSLPDDFKLRHGWTKYVLRQAFRTSMPRSVVNRQDKMGFETPEEKWLRNDLKEDMLGIIHSSLLVDHGLVERQGLSHLYAAFLKRQPQVAYMDISRLLIMELWLRYFFSEMKKPSTP